MKHCFDFCFLEFLVSVGLYLWRFTGGFVVLVGVLGVFRFARSCAAAVGCVEELPSSHVPYNQRCGLCWFFLHEILLSLVRRKGCWGLEGVSLLFRGWSTATIRPTFSPTRWRGVSFQDGRSSSPPWLILSAFDVGRYAWLLSCHFSRLDLTSSTVVFLGRMKHSPCGMNSGATSTPPDRSPAGCWKKSAPLSSWSIWWTMNFHQKIVSGTCSRKSLPSPDQAPLVPMFFPVVWLSSILVVWLSSPLSGFLPRCLAFFPVFWLPSPFSGFFPSPFSGFLPSPLSGFLPRCLASIPVVWLSSPLSGFLPRCLAFFPVVWLPSPLSGFLPRCLAFFPVVWLSSPLSGFLPFPSRTDFDTLPLLWKFFSFLTVFCKTGLEKTSHASYLTQKSTASQKNIAMVAMVAMGVFPFDNFFLGLKQKSEKKVHTFGHDYLDVERGNCLMNTHCQTMLWRKRGKAPNDAYCSTQCSNGNSLGSFLFPRQDNHVQRRSWISASFQKTFGIFKLTFFFCREKKINFLRAMRKNGFVRSSHETAGNSSAWKFFLFFFDFFFWGYGIMGRRCGLPESVRHAGRRGEHGGPADGAGEVLSRLHPRPGLRHGVRGCRLCDALHQRQAHSRGRPDAQCLSV